MLVKDYKSPRSGKTHATRFLRIKPSHDGSSKEAIADWQTAISVQFGSGSGKNFGT